ncbi:alcohol dehydrogenase catalytic domain-containing protein [Oscillospiraceae bacterium HV4-5-C5C]|nr:alcohol dehydrogenase catalytic domain-containing protein [Oscillospiraceae bacterium HV4-5-C5C]
MSDERKEAAQDIALPSYMRAIVFDGQKAVWQPRQPLPEPRSGESLLKILLAGVCNTDKEILRGYRPDFKGVMGHEFVAVVVRSDQPALIGRRVCGEINLVCHTCLYCRSGRPHHCSYRRVPGISGKDGCFAEYMTLPTELLHLVPDTLADEQAVYCEPLAAALEIPEQNHIRPSQELAVLGDGRLAFMVAQVLALSGAPVTVIGHHPEKLDRFKPFARTLLQPEGSYEVVVDATGQPAGLTTAVGLTRSGGRLIIKSTYADLSQIDMSEIVVRELQIDGSRCGPFEPALRLLEKGWVRLPEVERYRPEAFAEAFASRAFKAAIDFREVDKRD